MQDILLENISKSYEKGTVTAVDDISFDVKPQELFGLIGPDGAGKSSIFRILTTLLLPDSGSARVCGHDVIDDYRILRSKIGYMPGRFSLYQDLTVEENLTFFATVFNTSITANYDLIKEIYVQLEPFKNRRAGKLSGGMKQKLALCCALIHRPEVLFLDEPTTGVDVVSRKEFWEILARLKQEDITILVSTPYMDEAMNCDRIALVQAGRLLSVDTPVEIINQFPDDLFAIKADDMGALLHELKQSDYLSSCNAFGDYHHITFKSGIIHAEEALRVALNKHHHNIEIKPIQATIEDCFIRLMERNSN